MCKLRTSGKINNIIFRLTTSITIFIFSLTSTTAGVLNKPAALNDAIDKPSTLRTLSVKLSSPGRKDLEMAARGDNDDSPSDALQKLVYLYSQDPTNEANRDEIVKIAGELNIDIEPQLLDCFETLKAMNIDIPKKIESGEIKVDVVMNLLTSVGKEGRKEVDRDYSESDSIMLRGGRFKGVDMLDNSYDLGVASGVYHVIDLHFKPNGISVKPHKEANKKLILHCLALNAGVGSRDVSLTFNSGNIKGEVHMYGRGFSQQNIEQVKALTQGMIKAGITTGEYYWLFPADNVILPSVKNISEIYDKDHGFYLHALSWRVIGQNLATLLKWGPPLGQMARKPGGIGEESYDVKRFIEKPNIAELTFRVIENAIEEADYTKEGFLQELAKVMGTTVNDLNTRCHNNPLALLVMPMVSDKGAWEGMYALNLARDAIDKTLKAEGKQPLSNDEWKSILGTLKEPGLLSSKGYIEKLTKSSFSENEWIQLYRQAQETAQPAKDLVNQVLDKGGRNSFANTFYFLITRKFAEKFYELYKDMWQPQPKEIRDTEPFDWSTFILTPMVIDLTKEDIAAKRKVPEEWSKIYKDKIEKYGAFYKTQPDWDAMWHKAQELKKAGNGLKGVDVPLWIDVGTPRESQEALMLGVSTANPIKRALYLGLFNHEIPKSEINIEQGAVTQGTIQYNTGPVRIDSDSAVIVTGEGILKVGKNVTIEESLFIIDIPKGQTATIPDDTIISCSSIEGAIKGEGKGDYIYRLYSTQGVTFMGRKVQGTSLTSKGPMDIHHDVGILIKSVIDTPVGETPWTYREFFDGDKQGPVINFTQQRERARQLRVSIEKYKQSIRSSGAAEKLDSVKGLSLEAKVELQHIFKEIYDCSNLSNRQLAAHCAEKFPSLNEKGAEIIFDNIVRIYQRGFLLLPVKIKGKIIIAYYDSEGKLATLSPKEIDSLNLTDKVKVLLFRDSKASLKEKIEEALRFIEKRIEPAEKDELLKNIESSNFEPISSGDWQWIFAETVRYLLDKKKMEYIDAIKLLVERQSMVGDVKDVFASTIIEKTGIFYKQFNPGLKGKGKSNLVPPKPINDACFLCYDNIKYTDPDEVFIPWKGPASGNSYHIYANYFPVYRNHFVINNVGHVEQHMFASEIADMLIFLKYAPDIRLVYNGKNAGATKPEHQHYQGTTDRMSIEDYSGRKEIIHQQGDRVSVSRFTDYPAELFAIEGKDIDEVTDISGKIAMLLYAKEYNIDAAFVYNQQTGIFTTLIFPRKERFYTSADGFRISPGTPEMCGLLVVGKPEGRKFYEQLKDEEISDILSRLSVPQQELSYIYEVLRGDISYEKALAVINTGERDELSLGDIYDMVYRSFMNLKPHAEADKTVILNREKLSRYQSAFTESDAVGNPIPAQTDIYTAFINLPSPETDLSGFLNTRTDEVVKVLPPDARYYKVLPSSYHISSVVLQDLGLTKDIAPELFDSQDTKLTKEEREMLVDILADVVKTMKPFKLTLDRIIMGTDGTLFAAFKDESGEVTRIRNEFFARAKKYFEEKGAANKISDRKRPKDIVAVSLLRVLSDIDQDTLVKLQKLFPNWQNLSEKGYTFTVDSISVAHETRWMHYAYEDEQEFPLSIKSSSAGGTDQKVVKERQMRQWSTIGEMAKTQLSSPEFYNVLYQELISLGAEAEKAKDAISKLQKGDIRLYDEPLEVIDKNGNVIGIMDRNLVHKTGLLHRTANAFVITPDGKILLQRRPLFTFKPQLNKIEPGRLSIYGGHAGINSDCVEADQHYKRTIINELKDELDLPELKGHLVKVGGEEEYTDTKGMNNEYRALFAYVLEKSEYESLQRSVEEIRKRKLETTREKFEDSIETAQKEKMGKGEIYGRIFVKLSEVVDAKRNTNGRFITITEPFKDSKGPEEVNFTSDLLERLADNKDVMDRIIKIIPRGGDYDESAVKSSSAGMLNPDDIASLNTDALDEAIAFNEGTLKDVYLQSKYAGEISKIAKPGNTIAINDAIIPEGQREVVNSLYGENSALLLELQRRTGCTISLLSQLKEIEGELIIISHKKLDKYDKAKYLIVKDTELYLPLAPLVAIAKLLIGAEDKTAEELAQILNNNDLYRSIFGCPANERTIQDFIKTGIFELPPIKMVDYNELEQLQRQALAALIAA